MEKESKMVNVPSKVFYQGEWPGEEKGIIMNFYNGTIELDQQNNSTILISEENLEAFIKSLRSGFKRAKEIRK